MNKDMGWVRVYRSIQENWLWDRKPFSDGQAWIDLILLANHKDHKFMYKGEQLVAKRGQLNRSIASLAERWGWSKSKATRFFKDLKADGMVTIESDHNRTTITIENYASMQDLETTSGSRTEDERSTSETRVKHERNTDETRMKPYNNEIMKECNNEIRERGTKRTTIPPTLEEVRSYCEERGNRVDPERFMDYYSSNGWMVGRNKMKDWKAAVRNWEKKENDYGRLQNKDTDRSGVSGEVARSGNPIYRVKSKVLT